MMEKHEAHKVIAAMPADAALKLLEIGVRSLKPETLESCLNLTLEEFILASLIACIEEAGRAVEELETCPGNSAAGLN